MMENQALMNDSLVESTPTFRLCSDPNPKLGFYLLGFPKPVRSSLNTIHEPFRCVSLALSENQWVERRLGELFRRTPQRRSLIKWYSEPLVLGPL